MARRVSHPKNTHLRVDLGDRKAIEECFATYKLQRTGDVRHRLADISKTQHLLGCKPSYRIEADIAKAWHRYICNYKKPL